MFSAKRLFTVNLYVMSHNSISRTLSSVTLPAGEWSFNYTSHLEGPENTLAKQVQQVDNEVAECGENEC